MHLEREATVVAPARPPIEAVFVYDGECSQCAHAARSFDVAPRIAALSWHDDEAQEAIRAQFRELVPASALFDRKSGQVYGADAALRELRRREATASIAAHFAGPSHDHAEGAVGEADPDDPELRTAEGVHGLSPAVRARLPALIAAAEDRSSN